MADTTLPGSTGRDAATPGPWEACGQYVRTAITNPEVAGAHLPRGWLIATCEIGAVDGVANARLIAAAPDLLAVAELLALATDEGDDAAQGTHYVDKAGRIRCKGSFLETIEKARAALSLAGGGK